MTLKVIKEQKLTNTAKGDIWILLTAEDNGYQVSVETETEVVSKRNCKSEYLDACKFFDILIFQLREDAYPLTSMEVN